MLVFVYEFITGGGMWSLGGAPPEGSLLIEGQAMASAVIADFAAIPGCRVVTLRDARLPPAALPATIHPIDSQAAEQASLAHWGAQADWTLVIAPEFRGALLSRARQIVAVSGRLLSPGVDVIELAGNKQRTAEHLERNGCRVPSGCIWPRPEGLGAHSPDKEIRFPAVWKPLDGCGSLGIEWIPDRTVLDSREWPSTGRLETYCPGIAASVSVLAGTAGVVSLPACEQQLSTDGRFAYLGGRLPLAPELAARAQSLAAAACRTLPAPQGYLGIDLVLGEPEDGQEDYIIEINPRLTTSYVGLRKLARENLAGAMLAVAAGEVPALSWHETTLEFSAAGEVLVDSTRSPILARSLR
jgi:predicted ATP-grasp superfamily ATP-dependent carboligase